MNPQRDPPTAPPYPGEPQLDLSEGTHFSYALQWFAFAAILALGYPIYVKRHTYQAK